MAVLSSAPAAAGNSSHDSAEMGASGGMRLVASQILGLGSFSVSESHSASLPVNLSGLSFRDDCLLLLCLRGRSRVLSGQVCPGAGVDTGYRGKNSKKFTYQSAWSPRRLAASSEWKDFEIVVPVKPVTETAQAENAVSNLSVVSPDSPFLNIPRKIMGQCEFAGLVLDVYYLPTNPIGLGHQVY